MRVRRLRAVIRWHAADVNPDDQLAAVLDMLGEETPQTPRAGTTRPGLQKPAKSGRT